MTIHGVDISSYQGQINWDKLATKAQFVFIRAAVAKSPDVYLERNVQEAKRVGIPYGLYFLPYPINLTAFKVQAEFHGALYKQYGSQLFPVWDCEVDGGLNKNDLGNWLEKYAKWFMYYTGIDQLEKIITYTRAGWFDYEMPLTNTFWRTQLWAADYTPPLNIPLEWSNHGKKAIIWQTGVYKPATDYGCPAPPYAAYGIDVNQFMGSAAEFEELFKIAPHEIPVTPPVIPPTFSTHVVTKVVCNPRNRANLDPQFDAGTFIKGVVFEKVGGMTQDFQGVKVFLHKSVIEDV